jgi:hypothetical protein
MRDARDGAVGWGNASPPIEDNTPQTAIHAKSCSVLVVSVCCVGAYARSYGLGSRLWIDFDVITIGSVLP